MADGTRETAAEVPNASQPAAPPSSPCPLCAASTITLLAEVDAKLYWRCHACGLTFLDPAARPGPEAEHRHYLSHENRIDDPGYRRFLSRLADPLLARIGNAASGLDYGCGPGPALAAMLREAGHEMALYDPFFAPDRSVLDNWYDFITLTETAEHFHDPAREFESLAARLKPGGLLAVMTCFQTDDARFPAWHYVKDPTHVVFYKSETFTHLAARLHLTVEISAKDIAFLRKLV